MALLLRRVRLSLASIHGTASVLLVRYGVLFFLSFSRRGFFTSSSSPGHAGCVKVGLLGWFPAFVSRLHMLSSFSLLILLL